MSGQEYVSKKVSAADPGKGRKAGIVAWLTIVVSFMALYFALLNPAEEFFYLYIVLGLSLVFGVGGMAAFDVDIDLRFDESQIRVLAEGILGGLALVALQVIVSAIVAVAQISLSATPQELALMAPAPEELIFTMIIFGTLRSAMPGMPWFVAAIPSASIFALYHFFAYGIHWILTPVIFVAGLICAYLYERTRDIGTSMVAHLINNGAFFMVAMAVLFFTYWWIGAIVIVVYILWMTCRRK